MKNKTLKIIAVLLIAIALVTLATTIVRATNGFVEIKPQDPGKPATTISTTAGKILYIVRIIGIKYVAASPNEKAEYKKGMTIYVVGAVLLFGASFLLGVVQDFVSGIN